MDLSYAVNRRRGRDASCFVAAQQDLFRAWTRKKKAPKSTENQDHHFHAQVVIPPFSSTPTAHTFTCTVLLVVINLHHLRIYSVADENCIQIWYYLIVFNFCDIFKVIIFLNCLSLHPSSEEKRRRI